MNEMQIVSTTTTDRLDKVYILLNSIKQNKLKTTKIVYNLFVQYDEQYDFRSCTEYFKPLNSEDFSIILENVDVFKDSVKTPYRNHLYYAKCLLSQYFYDLDKILFLDVDLVFIKEIESLWNQNINDYYLGACIDPTWQFCSNYKHDLANTGTSNYFNAGVILFNLRKIREDKKDEELLNWCLNWDFNTLQCICHDQTLLNYILKNKVKIIDFKYNNSLLATLGVAQIAYAFYLNKLGYTNPLDSIADAVVLHFCGSNKPWEANCIYDMAFPYKKEAVELWSMILRKYSK